MQAQGCPVVRLGRVHVDWLDKASFGPGYKPGSCTSGGFRIPVSLDGPLDGIAGAPSGGSRTPGVIEGDALNASRAHHHRVEQQRCTRCNGSLPLPLHLAINRNRILDDISTRGDVDACSRASRANKLNR